MTGFFRPTERAFVREVLTQVRARRRGRTRVATTDAD
jgi:hypothetical protein